MTSSGSSSSRLLVTTSTRDVGRHGDVDGAVLGGGGDVQQLGDVVALQVDGGVGLLLAAGPRRVLRAVAGEDVVDRGLGVGARRARARSSRRSAGSRCRRRRPCDRRARRRTGRRRSMRRSAGSGGRTSCWCACGRGCRRRWWARGPRRWPRPGSRRGTARRPSGGRTGSTRCTGSASVSIGPITAMSANRSTPTTCTSSCSSSPMVTLTSSNGFDDMGVGEQVAVGEDEPAARPERGLDVGRGRAEAVEDVARRPVLARRRGRSPRTHRRRRRRRRRRRWPPRPTGRRWRRRGQRGDDGRRAFRTTWRERTGASSV